MNHLRILVAIAIFCHFAAAVRAQTVAPDPAPTIITTAPYTISKSGYYQLGANLAGPNITGNIITIAADNVVLDFAGHYIIGPANPTTTLYGVYAKDHNNLTIQNGKISFCETGILLDGSDTNSNNLIQRVQNVTIAHCTTFGISLNNVTGAYVSDSRFISIGGSAFVQYCAGINLTAGTGVKITGNDFLNMVAATKPNFSDSAIGVECSFSADAFVVNNTFTSCQYSIDGGNYRDNLTIKSGAPTSGTDDGNNH